MAALTDLTIAQLTAALASKDTSAVEVAEAHLAKLDQHRALNAFITETPDRARAMAKASDERRWKGEAGLLDGVPLAIKDLFCTEGVPTTAASRILDGFVPTYESTVTANLWKAGAVMVGKTNLDEFAMGSSNMTSHFGGVENPWKRKGDNRKLVTTYLRVGFDGDGAWRTFGLRKDFHPALKVQMEDDITASIVVPATALQNLPEGTDPGLSLKFVANCEQRLFQRPDDAIHRGYDKQAELDFVQPDNFFSNYEPLSDNDARAMVEDALGFNQFTAPMQQFISAIAGSPLPRYFVCTANPRLVDGKPTKNPRYLQKRPDLVRAQETYLAEVAARLRRRVPPGLPLYTPVTAVLPGRRNNPPEAGVRALACYNPIHYFELPELFMEVICSMTGKSPSTTGAGSEGALTKGPFNALPPIIDLNNALVAWILCGHHGFVTAAGYVGPHLRVDHDVSLIVPEVWCRLSREESSPAFLKANHYLETCRDFEYKGKKVLASRLGWRINTRFVHSFFGRVFNHPHAVFTEAMLRPELQDRDVFADSVDNIVVTQKRVAQQYFNDGSIAQACPPLRALLHIMKDDAFEGKDLEHPDIRNLFTRESLLASPWFAARLAAKQKIDRALWRRHCDYLNSFIRRPSHADVAEQIGIPARLIQARKTLETVEAPGYLEQLAGTIGAEPIEAYL